MSRDWDPETDPPPDGTDQPNDVERPGDTHPGDPVPVPPTEVPPAPIEEPNVPHEPDPDPIGDPQTKEPMRIV